jgi:hypothetical protein
VSAQWGHRARKADERPWACSRPTVPRAHTRCMDRDRDPFALGLSEYRRGRFRVAWASRSTRSSHTKRTSPLGTSPAVRSAGTRGSASNHIDSCDAYRRRRRPTFPKGTEKG